MKKVYLVLFMSFWIVTAIAQNKRANLSVGGGLLVSPDSEFFINVEPKVQISNKTRLGLSTRFGTGEGSFTSYLMDINFKPDKGGFYVGLGVGSVTYETETPEIRLPTGSIPPRRVRNSSNTIAPRIGFQGPVDLDLTYYFVEGGSYTTFGISYVIGYKEIKEE